MTDNKDNTEVNRDEGEKVNGQENHSGGDSDGGGGGGGGMDNPAFDDSIDGSSKPGSSDQDDEKEKVEEEEKVGELIEDIKTKEDTNGLPRITFKANGKTARNNSVFEEKDGVVIPISPETVTVDLQGPEADGKGE